MDSETSNPHATILGVLNFLAASVFLILGIITMFAGIVGGAVFGAMMENWVPGGAEMGALGAMVFVIGGLFLAVLGLLPLFTGIGLLKRRPWGRVLGFITASMAGLLAIGALFAFDVVSVLIQGGYAVYAFWALTREEVAAEFTTATAT